MQPLKEHRYVVRLIPSLREISHPIALDNLPLAGTSISVSDNKGFLWAEEVQFNGKYVVITSHRGTLALSYLPFAGSKEVGYVDGNLILFHFDNHLQVSLKSTSAFLPSGVTAKIFALYNPNKKTKGFNSLHTFTTNTEETLKKSIDK